VPMEPPPGSKPKNPLGGGGAMRRVGYADVLNTQVVQQAIEMGWSIPQPRLNRLGAVQVWYDQREGG
jgi:hypothetical protein